jgi:adenylate cyclase
MADSRTPGEDTGNVARDKPSASEVRAALDRILASRCFQQAGRASDFLRFVVEQTLQGGGQRLKGYTIGVEVFGRPADFDAQSDALVRVEAGRLRRRLVEYYASDGAADPIRIELPRGTYAVEYEFATAAAEEVPAEPVPEPPPAVERGAIPWRGVAAAFGALFAVAAGVIAWQLTELREARALALLAEPQRMEWARIVVVPFENLSGDPSLDAIAASMTEEIMLRLDELDLFVVASQAKWYGPGEGASVETAAGGYVLTGSVRGTEEEARITARLIEAESGAQLWTAAYDEPVLFHGLPVLQDRTARSSKRSFSGRDGRRMSRSCAIASRRITSTGAASHRRGTKRLLRVCKASALANRISRPCGPGSRCCTSTSFRRRSVATAWTRSKRHGRPPR